RTNSRPDLASAPIARPSNANRGSLAAPPDPFGRQICYTETMKPKSARGASTRQRIIETAAKLMYKNGVNGTSVDDVLAASGTGKSQFYHYFTSKEALVKELIPFHLEKLTAARADLLTNLNSQAGIEAWLDQILADQRAGLYADGCPIGNLAS